VEVREVVDRWYITASESIVRESRLRWSVESGDGGHPYFEKGNVSPGLGMGKVGWGGGKTGYTKLEVDGRAERNWEFGCRGENRDGLGRKGTFEPRVNGKGNYWGSPNKAGFF
jgi:hypothetical protein